MKHWLALQLVLAHLVWIGGCSSNFTLHSCLCSVSCGADLNETTLLTNSTTITHGSVCQLQNVSASNRPDLEGPDEQVERVCFCGNSSAGAQCPEQSDSTVHLFPGELHTIHIFTANALGAAIRMPIVARLNKSWQVGRIKQIFGENCSEISFSIASNETDTGGLVEFFVPSYTAMATMSVYLEDCPHGFSLNTETLTCQCSEFVSNMTSVKCKTSNGALVVQFLEWIGLVNNSLAYTDRCLLGYCSTINTRNVTTAVVDVGNDSQLCTGNHDGVACGGCEDGFSVVFGDVACYRCSNWYLFTILLYLIAGILLVTGVFALDLTVSRGTVIGPIFLANLFLSTNLFTFSTIPDIYKPVLIWVSLIGLSLGFPLCFYDGMTSLQKAVLEFIFPTYIISLVLVIIIVSRYSPLVARLVSHSSVKALATLLFLTYGKVLRSIFKFLQHNIVVLETGEHRVVWLIDGNVAFFQGWHAVACVFAIVVLLTLVLPYTILITFGPFMTRWRIVTKLKPFLDAHSGPYKDRYRYWFGVRLWVIIVAAILTALARAYWIVFLFIMKIIVIVFLFVEALIKPYKKNILNYLDTALILPFSLTLTSVLASYCIPDPDDQIVFLISIGIVLSTINLLSFCAIVVYHLNDLFNLADKIKKTGCFKKLHKTHKDKPNTTNPVPAVQVVHMPKHNFYDGSKLREPALSLGQH